MQQSQTSSDESPETGASETPTDSESGHQVDQKSQLEQVADLLREPEAKADSERESEKPSESEKKGKPETINDFAEMHNVDVKDLYSLKFNFGEGDGESRTLSEMKDIAANANQLEVDRLTFDETKTKQETEFVRAQAELQEIVNLLPKTAITPELLKVITDKRAGILAKEQGLTLSVIPEWNDSDKETQDRTQMREHLAQYGFGPAYLDSVTDHKTLKYIRDNMQRQQRIERVLAQVKQVNKPGHKPSGNSNTPAKLPAASRPGKQRTVDQQVSAVAELLTASSN